MGSDGVLPLQSGVQLLYLWCAIIYGNEEFKVLTEVKRNKTAATEQTLKPGVNYLTPSHIFTAYKAKTGLLQQAIAPQDLAFATKEPALCTERRSRSGSERWKVTALVPSL